MIQLVLFYAYAAASVIGAIGMVVARKLVHAVGFMLITLCSIAALYLAIGSEFLAAMQLFVYGGAVTVLAMFVLMLTRQGADEQAGEDHGESRSKAAVRWIALFVCLTLFAVLAMTFASSEWELAAEAPHTTESIATILFSRYVLPFEIAGLALTIALIGAIVLAREDDLIDASAIDVTDDDLDEDGELV